MKPQEIEDLSFKIIDKEAGDHGFDDAHWQVVRRMIHTSADFEYIKSVRFYENALSSGVKAIQRGCSIFTDTNMARVGIRKGEISSFGGEVKCMITDKDVAEKARTTGVTRALAAVDKASGEMDGGIYVVGNAPTALLRLIELIRENKIKPALIVGFPVGFVNAAESKDELMTLDFPYISNKGRKGGSNVAASIINAMAIMAAKQ
ncbi:precorrin-8X methylmutase [Desulfocicer vacuolatum DSM 3385]|uniref:Precorrin-8X methylmutase n=1 Tax=Desulfocicer vacuolatum DSM 3385 TaxID=1121400 RepID=A0A1W2CA76_9BACT|nr:precorrin-8X methylmutase [Desulfocicer vacuolatum]SMC81996.1 precorrin-8X methylmutase [Desulfocicer vacuolatum DSM 3385]